MANTINDILIRKFRPEDKESVRKISYKTSFLDNPHAFLDDEELVVDALTLYFMDYEAESCFVAVFQGNVIGYLIGAKSDVCMNRILLSRIYPHLLMKALRKGMFFRLKSLQCLIHFLISFLRGEFFTPNFSKEFPAVLHINIDKNFRGERIGHKLMEHYLEYLKENKVVGVRASTVSELAKNFFVQVGFEILFQSERSYMRYRLGKDVPLYILGRRI